MREAVGVGLTCRGPARWPGFSSRGTNPPSHTRPSLSLSPTSFLSRDLEGTAARQGGRTDVGAATSRADQGRVLSPYLLSLQPAAERPTERREIDPETHLRLSSAATVRRHLRRPLGCFALVDTVPCNFKSLDQYLCSLDVYPHVYLVKRNLQLKAICVQILLANYLSQEIGYSCLRREQKTC